MISYRLDWVRVAALAAAAIGLSLGGCGPDTGGRVAVKGKVVLKGTPLKEGIIKFVPKTPGGPESEGGTQILNGEYALTGTDGLIPGTYKVLLTAGDGKTKADTDEPPGPTGANIISKDLFPPEYNRNTKQEVTVSKSGPNVFDYNVP